MVVLLLVGCGRVPESKPIGCSRFDSLSKPLDPNQMVSILEEEQANRSAPLLFCHSARPIQGQRPKDHCFGSKRCHKTLWSFQNRKTTGPSRRKTTPARAFEGRPPTRWDLHRLFGFFAGGRNGQRTRQRYCQAQPKDQVTHSIVPTPKLQLHRVVSHRIRESQHHRLFAVGCSTPRTVLW